MSLDKREIGLLDTAFALSSCSRACPIVVPYLSSRPSEQVDTAGLLQTCTASFGMSAKRSRAGQELGQSSKKPKLDGREEEKRVDGLCLHCLKRGHSKATCSSSGHRKATATPRFRISAPSRKLLLTISCRHWRSVMKLGPSSSMSLDVEPGRHTYTTLLLLRCVGLVWTFQRLVLQLSLRYFFKMAELHTLCSKSL